MKKIDPQALANVLGMYVMKDHDGTWFASNDRPVVEYNAYRASIMHQSGTEPNFIRVVDFFELQEELQELIEYTGDWKDSLFCPSGGCE